MKKKLLYLTIILAVCLGVGSFIYLKSNQDASAKSGVSATELDSQVLYEWLDLSLALSKEIPGFSPPVTARAVGYSSLSLYESIRFGIPNSSSMTGQISEFDANYLSDIQHDKVYDWRLVANANSAEIYRSLYGVASPESISRIDAKESILKSKYSTGVKSEVIIDSEELGRQVARAVAKYADTDGQSEGYLHNFSEIYQPPSGDGLWVPTPDDFQKALQPYWGDVRPFMSDNIKPVLPVPPPEYSLDKNSVFYKEAQEVYDTVQALTQDQIDIAEFWSDDPGKTATPPGHSLSILMQVLKNEDSSLAESVTTNAKLGLGLHDSFVSCWYAKYEYNYIRPITFIRKNIDPEFTIPLGTPPFPEYPSGHSVQSGTSAQILADIYGEDYSFIDSTHKDRTDMNGTPRSFNSFSEFAEEAAISRLYGGIHFRSAIDLGVDQGREIGKNIGKLKFTE